MIQTQLLNTCQLVLFKPWLYITPYAGRADGIAKPALTRFSNGYDVTVLALLSRRYVHHMARCSIIAWQENQFLFDFLIDATMF